MATLECRLLQKAVRASRTPRKMMLNGGRKVTDGSFSFEPSKPYMHRRRAEGDPRAEVNRCLKRAAWIGKLTKRVSTS